MRTVAAEPTLSAVAGARVAADVAAARSGVTVEQAHEADDLAAIGSVIDAIWHPAPGSEPVNLLILRVLEHTGSYCAIARSGQEIIGACIGFLAVEPAGCLHSHLTGVIASAEGRHVGLALKLDQRAWALEHGLSSIEWTFDPLVRRNAYFNCVKLAAVPREYLPDFYGVMDDRTNVGQGSDRLVAEWNLLDPAVLDAAHGRYVSRSMVELTNGPDTVLALDSAAGRPVIGSKPNAATRTVLVRIPEDISEIRTADPDLARHWRQAVRAALMNLRDGGWSITGMTRDGCYLLTRT